MTEVVNLSQLDPNGEYSYSDYLTWKFEQAIEIFKGKIFPMASPSSTHQRVALRIINGLEKYLIAKPCELFIAPLDVRLYDRKKSLKADKDILTVLQPDLFIVCDLNKLEERGCLGAPDLVIEILSPGNSKREMKIKKELYEESGVREYWIVDPNHETVARFNIETEEKFGNPKMFSSDDELNSIIFPDLILDLNKVFPAEIL